MQSASVSSLRKEYDDFLSALHETADARAVALRLGNVRSLSLHLLRTNPNCFGFPDELYVSLLASADSYEASYSRLEEMKRKGIAPTGRHYLAVLYALLTSPSAPKIDLSVVVSCFAQARRDRTLGAQAWSAAFLACRMLRLPAEVFDEWWRQMHEAKEVAPFAALLHALAWCAEKQDVERALRSWKLMKSFSSEDLAGVSLQAHIALLRTVEYVRFDGGMRQFVFDAIKRSVNPQELVVLSWKSLIDFSRSLSLESAVRLVHMRSGGHDDRVPFAVWVALLRQFALAHRVADVDALFAMVRAKYTLSSNQKGRLLYTVMQMYASLTEPDTNTVISLFVEHVLQCPPNEPRVVPSTALFRCLLKSADDPATASELYRDALSMNVQLDAAAYRSLYAREGAMSMSYLSRNLPEAYGPSELDNLLSVPVDADPHRLREEARKRRGKDVVPSVD